MIAVTVLLINCLRPVIARKIQSRAGGEHERPRSWVLDMIRRRVARHEFAKQPCIR